MKVHELIAVLQEMPQNADIYVEDGDSSGVVGIGGLIREPQASQEWNDNRENYVVVL